MQSLKFSFEISILIWSLITLCYSFAKILSAKIKFEIISENTVSLKCRLHTHTHTHTHSHKHTQFSDLLRISGTPSQGELFKLKLIGYMVTCDTYLEGVLGRYVTSTGKFVVLELGYGLSYMCRLSNNVRPSEAISLPNFITTVEGGMFELEPSTILKSGSIIFSAHSNLMLFLIISFL